MSGYIYGLFWNKGCEHFDFVYTESDSDKKNINTQNLDKIDTSTIHSVELSNIQLDNINDKFCNLSFESLIINRCILESIENLKLNKSLKKLIIIDSDIKSFNKLENMNIEELSIISTKNIGLDEILNMKKLKILNYKSNISTNKITLLPNLEPLENIITLNLSDNGITDITNLGYLINLLSIDLGHNDLDNIDLLGKYHKLKYVYLNNNKLKNIDKLQNNTDIKYLVVNNNLIENINIISQFEDLEFLNILDNPISHLPDLFKFKKLDLENLKINWKHIIDMKGMKGLSLIKNIIKSMMNHN